MNKSKMTLNYSNGFLLQYFSFNQLRLLLAIIPLLFFCKVNSQERTNIKLPFIEKKQVGVLTNSKGWLNNVDGQWISSQNKIPYPLEKRSAILQSYEKYGLGTDNFIFFEIRRIQILDSTYYILIKKYKDGYYKYSTIEKGWVGNISFDYFVFSKSDFDSVKFSHSDKINNLTILNIYYGSIKYTSSQNTYINDIERDIANSIKEQIQNKSNHLFIQFIKYSKTGLVRFNINNDSIISYNEKGFFQSDDIFNQFYFETTETLFNNLFK